MISVCNCMCQYEHNLINCMCSETITVKCGQTRNLYFFDLPFVSSFRQRGPKGAVGRNGVPGPVGPPGIPGTRGERGAIGDLGVKGRAGPKGVQGPSVSNSLTGCLPSELTHILSVCHPILCHSKSQQFLNGLGFCPAGSWSD